MVSMSIFIVALAVHASSEALPHALKPLADSADAFADSIAKLERQTDAVVADAALVKRVAKNKTTREAVLDYMGSALVSGMPSTKKYDEAADSALDAAAALEKADLASKQAKLALHHARHWIGSVNVSAAEEARLEGLRKDSRTADDDLVKAKEELKESVKEAKGASRDLLDATKAYAKTFDEHVDELMRSSERHEAAAKKAMRVAITQARVAANAEVKKQNDGRAEE
jgi:hypothetical protein